MTIQALGWKYNRKYLPLPDDIALVAYWYQMEPHGAFPKVQAKDDLAIHWFRSPAGACRSLPALASNLDETG